MEHGGYNAKISRAADALWRTKVAPLQWSFNGMPIGERVWGLYGQPLEPPTFGRHADGKICFAVSALASAAHSPKLNCARVTVTMGARVESRICLLTDTVDELFIGVVAEKVDEYFTGDELTIMLTFAALDDDQIGVVRAKVDE